MHNGDLAGILIIGFITSAVVAVVWVVSTNARRKQVSRDIIELQVRVLDRCIANGELLGYLESDVTRKLMESATEANSPMPRILGALQGGIVLCVFGVANILLRKMGTSGDIRELLLILGTGTLAIGVGLLISTVASYALSKLLGLSRPR